LNQGSTSFFFSFWTAIIFFFKLLWFYNWILIIFNNGTKICPCIQKISQQKSKFMSIMMHDIESHVPVYFLIKKNLLFRKIQKWIFWKKNRKKWKFFIFTGWDRIWLKNALFSKIIRTDWIFVLQFFSFPMLRPIDFDQNCHFGAVLWSYSS